MAKVRINDARNVYVSFAQVSTDTAATYYVPIPVAGQIISFQAGCEASPDVDQSLTFELGGVAMEAGGSAAALDLLNADATGTIKSIEFDQGATERADAPENDDLLAEKGVFAIVNAGGGTVGRYTFLVTVRP